MRDLCQISGKLAIELLGKVPHYEVFIFDCQSIPKELALGIKKGRGTILTDLKGWYTPNTNK